MQSALCFSSSLAGKAVKSCKRQQASRRAMVRVSAEKEEPKFSFDSNRRSAVGYTEEDSAGQTNIFAVEPKTYVAGSAADTTGTGATVTIASIGFVAAMVFVGAGLVVNSAQTDVADVAPTGEYKLLSEYSAAFSAELSAAPAVVTASE